MILDETETVDESAQQKKVYLFTLAEHRIMYSSCVTFVLVVVTFRLVFCDDVRIWTSHLFPPYKWTPINWWK